MLSVVLGKETRGQDINLNQHKAGYYRPNKVWILDRMYVTELGKTINRTRTIWILDKFIFASLLRNCFFEKNKRSNPDLQTKPTQHFLQYPEAGQVYSTLHFKHMSFGWSCCKHKTINTFQIFSAMRSTLSYPRSAQAYSSWNRDDLGVVICWCFDGWSYMK